MLLGIGEWIALGGFAFGLLGMLSRGIYLLAGIKAELKVVTRQVYETNKLVVTHAKECDQDRMGLNVQLSDHARRLTSLEGA